MLGSGVSVSFQKNEKERSRRIFQRIEKNKASPNDIESLTTGSKTDKYYRELAPDKTIIIKTDNKTPQQVTSYIINQLKIRNILK